MRFFVTDLSLLTVKPYCILLAVAVCDVSDSFCAQFSLFVDSLSPDSVLTVILRLFSDWSLHCGGEVLS